MSTNQGSKAELGAPTLCLLTLCLLGHTLQSKVNSSFRLKKYRIQNKGIKPAGPQVFACKRARFQISTSQNTSGLHRKLHTKHRVDLQG
jgi:hypothetical protein